MDHVMYSVLKKQIDEVVTDEKVSSAVNNYLEKNPPEAGATVEQVEQIQKNADDIGGLKSDLADITTKSEVTNQLGKTSSNPTNSSTSSEAYRGWATRVSNKGDFNYVDMFYNVSSETELTCFVRNDDFSSDIATSNTITVNGKGVAHFMFENKVHIAGDNLYIGVIGNANNLTFAMATLDNGTVTDDVTADNTGTLHGNWSKAYGSANWSQFKNASIAKSFSLNFSYGISENITSIKKANSEYLGGIIADIKTENHTDEIMIGENGKLYAQRGIKFTKIYVSANGSDATGDGSIEKPFATIFHANEVIENSDFFNRYIIVVGKGTYTDLQTRYSGDAGGNGFQGVICKNYVFYESEDINNPQDTIIYWDGASGFSNPTKSQIIDKCPFHIEGKTVTHIKGFKFECKNLRYAMHVETGGSGCGMDALIEDCILDWGGRPDVVSTESEYEYHNCPAIGTGTSPLSKLTISRCDIKNSESDFGFQNHENPLYITNNGQFSVLAGAEVTIKDCNFNNTNVQFRNLLSRATTSRLSETHDIATLINNVGIKRLYLNEYDGDGKDRWWRFELKANDIVTNDVTDVLV